MAAPTPGWSAGPFVVGIEPIWSRDRKPVREIQIVDGRVFNQGGIPRRIHACRHGPDHILPAAHIDIVIGDDHEFGIHKLPQERPDSHHHPFRMARVLLFIETTAMR